MGILRRLPRVVTWTRDLRAGRQTCGVIVSPSQRPKLNSRLTPILKPLRSNRPPESGISTSMDQTTRYMPTQPRPRQRVIRWLAPEAWLNQAEIAGHVEAAEYNQHTPQVANDGREFVFRK